MPPLRLSVFGSALQGFRDSPCTIHMDIVPGMALRSPATERMWNMSRLSILCFIKHPRQHCLFLLVLPFLILVAVLSLTIDPIGACLLLLILPVPFLLLGILVLLLLSVLDLVFYQVVEGSDGAYQAAEVDGHELVVGLDAHGVCQFSTTSLAIALRRGQVGEQVEDVLKVAENGMIDRELSVKNLLQVGTDVTQPQVQTLERLKLVGDASGKCANSDVSNIS